MRKIVFDIEADGLLPSASRMWVLHAIDVDTQESYTFLEGDLGWKKLIDSCDVLIGHNITGFDIPLLEKLFNYKVDRKIKIRDTLIMSQILDYKRFPEGHSLEAWGSFLGYPKIKFDDFSKCTPEMIEYCAKDTEIAVRIYKTLLPELKEGMRFKQELLTYIEAEQYANEWTSKAEMYGWPFDVAKAEELRALLKVELDNAYKQLTHKLGTKTVALDKVRGTVEEKYPRWTKQGFYDVHTSRYFGIDPCSGYPGEEQPIQGPYCRVSFEPLSLDSVADVKLFLFRHGWVPTQYNFKFNEETGKKEKTSPKITEDSLEFLGGDGQLYLNFLTARSRYAVVDTWLKNVDSNNRVHGTCMLIGTPSMRARHQIIVNVPGTDAVWGKEMRELFTTLPGWKIIGCDSSGNQARGLAYYLNNKEYIELITKGDIHQFNADVLTKVLSEMGVDHVVARGQAKRILYAFLFGASGGKLWSYIFGKIDVKNGNELKKGFIKAVPGFKELLDKLSAVYAKTSQDGPGYIRSLVGNRIYVDSFHKLLVYLLQATEKITCSTAIMLTVRQLEQENIPYIPLIYYHDEKEFLVPDEYAERAAEIGKSSFEKGPKLYGINIMDGGAKIGNNWYEVH